jgi:hypothetical protein
VCPGCSYIHPVYTQDLRTATVEYKYIMSEVLIFVDKFVVLGFRRKTRDSHVVIVKIVINLIYNELLQKVYMEKREHDFHGSGHTEAFNPLTFNPFWIIL